jgi:cytidylate kinase
LLLLIEGTCGAGKTTLARFLARDARERGLSPLEVVPQSVTYGPLVPFEDAGTLDDRRNREHLDRVVDRLADRMQRGQRLVVDTLHLTQLVRPGCLSPKSFHTIDARLLELGARVVVLHLGEPTFAERVIEGRRNTGFARYIQKYGQSDAELVRHFMAEQDAILRAVTDSRLPVLHLDGTCAPEALSASVTARWP